MNDADLSERHRVLLVEKLRHFYIPAGLDNLLKPSGNFTYDQV
jgi:hypothetical protein